LFILIALILREWNALAKCSKASPHHARLQHIAGVYRTDARQLFTVIDGPFDSNVEPWDRSVVVK